MTMKQPKSFFNYPLLKRVFSFVQPYRFMFIGNLVLAIFLAFFTPIRPYLIQLTVNTAIGKPTILPEWVRFFLPNTAFESAIQLIIGITLFQVAFIIVETIFRFFFTFGMAWLGQQVIRDLRNKVYDKVMHWEMRQFDKTPLGTLTTRTINDIESINDIFSDGLIPILADFLTIIVTLATMFFINWQLTLICLIPFPIMLIATYFFKESVNKSFIQVRNAVAALNAFVQEHISGMMVVQLFHAEERELKKFDQINVAHRDANVKGILAYSLYFPVADVIAAVGSGLIVWMASTYILKEEITVGTLTAFIMFINLFFRPIRMLADRFNTLQMGIVSTERILTLLDSEDYIQNNGTLLADELQGDIEFDLFSFAYNEP